MGELKKWRDQDWVRIGTDGKIKANVVLKDKKNLIGVYLAVKQIVCRVNKEPPLLEKRNEKVAKEKLL